MPELPEVETMRRGIAQIAGSRILDAAPIRCELRPIQVRPRVAAFRRRCVGQRVREVDRAGKRVLIRLESEDVIVFEPRMTGLVLVADAPDVEHLRFRIELDHPRTRTIWFWDRRGLGSVQLLSPAEQSRRLGPDVLGPDALAITIRQLKDRLGTSRRAIKVALLDQRAVAGIGNLYAAEILHACRIDPTSACNALDGSSWTKIHRAIRLVLEEAIRYEGSTLGDGTYRNALNAAGGYQNHHRVYDREGQLCGRCRGTIRRIVQAQRATFYCPTCQRAT